jgi:hypothetical protein
MNALLPIDTSAKAAIPSATSDAIVLGATATTYPTLRQLVCLCAALPIAAAADTDFPNSATAPDSHGAFVLSPNVGIGQVILEWRPYRGNFSGAATFDDQTYRLVTGADDAIPTSNVSLKPLRPYLGTYFGVGWRGSAANKNIAWMVDLGIVRETTPTVALNLNSNIVQSNSHSDTDTTSMKFRISRRGKFSFTMQF